MPVLLPWLARQRNPADRKLRIPESHHGVPRRSEPAVHLVHLQEPRRHSRALLHADRQNETAAPRRSVRVMRRPRAGLLTMYVSFYEKIAAVRAEKEAVAAGVAARL